MVQVPSNLIPTRVTELPEPPSYDGQGLLLYTYNGTSYKITAQQLVAGVQGVTSVNASGGVTGMSFSGGPVTSVGVLTLAGVLNLSSGGTGGVDAPGARANLDAAQRGANIDITSLGGVTGGISSPDFVQLDIAAAASIALGKLRWNADTNTVAFGIIDGTQEVNIGQQLYAYVHNADSVSITRGQAVYLYQATGNRASVKLASNTGDPTSAKTLGLVAQTIGAGQNGFVITQGVLDKIDTSAFAEGDTLYLGSTAGALTATKPVAPNHLVYIGVVERANAGNGQIYVRPQNGYELDELHDVRITAKADGDLLQYYSAGPYWRNVSPTSVSVGSATTATTATNLAGGAANRIAYQTAANTTDFLIAPTTASTYLTWNGTSFAWAGVGGGGTVTSVAVSSTDLTVSGSPITSSGTISLALNTVPVSKGGTGQTTAQAAINALAGATTSGQYLRGNGTNVVMSAIQAADVPTLNQNTTGTASNVTGTVAIANGGTGATTKAAGYNALTPITTLGDIVYGDGANSATRLAGNTTSNKRFLTQTGTGAVSAAPGWNAIVDGDIPSALTGKTYNGLNLTANATGFQVAGGTTAKTLVVQNNLTLAGTDGSTLNIGAGGTLGTAAFTASTAYQPIDADLTAIAALTGTSGFLKTNGAGTWSVDTSTYLTGNQNITISGDASGSGTTSIALTLATVTAAKGGTGQTSYATGDLLYASGASALAKLAGNTTTTRQFLRQTGTGSVSAAPAWDTVTKTDVGLANVENTALSTWAGSANLTTLGTIATGTWSASTIAIARGGTGATTAVAAFDALSPATTLGDLIYSDGTDNVRLAGNTAAARRFLRQTGTGTVSAAPAWDALLDADVPSALTGKTYNGLSLTAAATGFTVAGGTTSKTLTISNTLTLAGTDGTTITLPATTGTVALNNQTFFLGTSSVAINRASGAISLTGVSIDGSAGSATTATTATNLAGGAADRIAYQTAANTTGFLAAPTTASTYLSWNGTSFAWVGIGGGGTVTSVAVSSTDLTVSGSPITASGTITLSLNTVPVSKGGTGATTLTGVVKGNGTSAFTAGSVNLASEVTGTLPVANGGTGQTTAQAAINALAGATTSGQYLRGNGTNVVMSAIQASDVPTLNQNTTGTASNVTGTVAIANGGTGATTQQAALNAIAGATTSGQFLRGNGTNVAMAAIQASDVPTLNQNTTGTASNVTGTVAIANGGTGQTTKTAAFNALSPLTALGDLIYSDGTDNVRLPGNIDSSRRFLTQTGTGTVSAAPGWNAIVDGDIPSALTGKTYNGLSLTANATGFQLAGGTTSKTLTVQNSLTLAGTDGTTITLPATTGTLALNNQTFFIGTTSVAINRASASLSLTGVNIDGSAGSATTATNANNTAVTDDTTTAATVYPTWVTANSGNLPQKVTSTKFTFNPSTGIINATGGICGGTF